MMMARVLSWGVFSFILSSTRFAAPAQAGQPAQTLLAALSQRALAALFRDKFLVGLSQMLDEEELHLPDSRHRRHAPADSELLYAKRWVLYAKRPFGGPHQSYLARYTPRRAENRRIVAIDEKRRTVTFTNRDYLRGSQLK
jgi:hypothetical protein